MTTLMHGISVALDVICGHGLACTSNIALDWSVRYWLAV